MRLVYFQGNNFGDELSPFVFRNLKPGYFQADEDTDFYGIGSVIGEDNFDTNRKKVLFSSGFSAYMGAPPRLEENCDVICVRGPITARLLGLDTSAAITDGALLLRSMTFKDVDKEFDFSYIPHWASEKKFDWKTLCEEMDLHYVSSQADFRFVIDEIRKSRVVISEAMHGIIVADMFRVPWVPVRTFARKFNVKWHDWHQSMELSYDPHVPPELYDANDYVVNKVQEKTHLPRSIARGVPQAFAVFQSLTSMKRAKRKLANLKNSRQFLSNDLDLAKRLDQLLEKLELFKKKYPLAN